MSDHEEQKKFLESQIDKTAGRFNEGFLAEHLLAVAYRNEEGDVIVCSAIGRDTTVLEVVAGIATLHNEPLSRMKEADRTRRVHEALERLRSEFPAPVLH